ncbi:MAG: vitamin K epoxide reductase family protein [Pyrinomonadaceae bacterium]|nr:vitamin K epoxide reductase family protein [Pyrinomonadaceae bacterium]
MNNQEVFVNQNRSAIAKLPLLAAIVALGGLVDSVYLTVHHYTAEPVPCSIINGCEQVLTSSYAEMFGIPTAAFGIAAYLLAFLLAILTAFGKNQTWMAFGVLVSIMTIFTGWLIYLQANVIEAFCQFCLLSAATTFTLLIIFLISRFVRSK